MPNRSSHKSKTLNTLYRVMQAAASRKRADRRHIVMNNRAGIAARIALPDGDVNMEWDEL